MHIIFYQNALNLSLERVAFYKISVKIKIFKIGSLKGAKVL